jgi:hypothetical protein
VRVRTRVRMRMLDALMTVALPPERLIAQQTLTGHAHRLVGATSATLVR